jgi:hypothetical protein
MKIEINYDPDLRALMAAESLAGERAVTRSMRVAGRAVQQDWRDQIARAGLGARLPRTIRQRAYPEAGESISAAALIWSNAPEIISAFDRGVTIRSKDGFFLAIPLPAAGPRGGRRPLTPGLWEARTGVRLRFVYRRGRASLLVADEVRLSSRGRASVRRSRRIGPAQRGATTVPIFVLLPQVQLKKRLDLAAGVSRTLSRLPQMIVDDWARQPLRVRNA